jgi:hypothetical protein
VNVESRPGAGTTVAVELPLVPRPVDPDRLDDTGVAIAPAAAPKAAPEPAPAAGGKS